MPKILIPSIKKGGPPPPSDRDILYGLILHSSAQKRVHMRRHPLLDLAAQNKATDMATRHYFSHTSPDGVTANANILATGFKLPSYYPVDGNTCESWALVSGNPEPKIGIMGYAVRLWTNSPHHFAHVFAQDDFYKNQECVGVGVADTHVGGTICVFVSAPCEGNP